MSYDAAVTNLAAPPPPKPFRGPKGPPPSKGPPSVPRDHAPDADIRPKGPPPPKGPPSVPRDHAPDADIRPKGPPPPKGPPSVPRDHAPDAAFGGPKGPPPPKGPPSVPRDHAPDADVRPKGPPPPKGPPSVPRDQPLPITAPGSQRGTPSYVPSPQNQDDPALQPRLPPPPKGPVRSPPQADVLPPAAYGAHSEQGALRVAPKSIPQPKRPPSTLMEPDTKSTPTSAARPPEVAASNTLPSSENHSSSFSPQPTSAPEATCPVVANATPYAAPLSDKGQPSTHVAADGRPAPPPPLNRPEYTVAQAPPPLTRQNEAQRSNDSAAFTGSFAGSVYPATDYYRQLPGVARHDFVRSNLPVETKAQYERARSPNYELTRLPTRMFPYEVPDTAKRPEKQTLDSVARSGRSAERDYSALDRFYSRPLWTEEHHPVGPPRDEGFNNRPVEGDAYRVDDLQDSRSVNARSSRREPLPTQREVAAISGALQKHRSPQENSLSPEIVDEYVSTVRRRDLERGRMPRELQELMLRSAARGSDVLLRVETKARRRSHR